MSFTQVWLDEHEIVLVYVPYARGISSTELKKECWITQSNKIVTGTLGLLDLLRAMNNYEI